MSCFNEIYSYTVFTKVCNLNGEELAESILINSANRLHPTRLNSLTRFN